MGLCHRYHVTLHDSEKLEMLQDRLEDLPPPVVVSAAARATAGTLCRIAGIPTALPRSSMQLQFHMLHFNVRLAGQGLATPQVM